MKATLNAGKKGAAGVSYAVALKTDGVYRKGDWDDRLVVIDGKPFLYDDCNNSLTSWYFSVSSGYVKTDETITLE